jgi:hypothetical protein
VVADVLGSGRGPAAPWATVRSGCQRSGRRALARRCG